MRILICAAAAALTLLAAPAFAQDISASGSCEDSEKLQGALRDAQKAVRVDSVDCDAISGVAGSHFTFSKDGRTLITFSGHSENREDMDRLILESVTLPGRAPMPVVRGICNGGNVPGNRVAVVCVASYTDGDKVIGVQTVFTDGAVR